MRFASTLPSSFMKYFPLFLGLLILFIYFTFVYFIFIRVSEQTPMECGFVVVGTICIIMILWSLYRTSTVDPGQIPKHTMQEYDESKFRDYCLSCAIKRPERSHHCSKCKRCILNMDHHCIWTSNCIGLNNRKYFLLILFWGCFGMSQAMLLGATNLDKLWHNVWQNDPKELITRALDIFVLVMTGSQFMNALGLFYFFWKNLKLVLINICTLDEMILEMEATSQRKYHTDLTVYDLGIRYNLQFYFGKSPLLWFLPLGKPLGDGYYWDKNTHDSELVETTIQE